MAAGGGGGSMAAGGGGGSMAAGGGRLMAAGGPAWPRIVLFGDSITQGSFGNGGWGAAIANKLVRKCDVLNRGLSGYNTKWARTVLPKIITQPTDQGFIAAVVVFFGANDSALKDVNPVQHIPLPEYAENLKHIIQYLKSIGICEEKVIMITSPPLDESAWEKTCIAKDVNPVQHIPLPEYAENLKHIIQYLKSIGICEEKVIMITSPPLDESAWEKTCIAKGNKLDRCNSVTKEYTQVCVRVATECGTDVLDLWTLMQNGNQNFSSYLLDGLHLSEKGSTFLETHLWPLLEKRTENLPMIFPHWSDIDQLNSLLL